ncbi:hypothetical protein E1B28_011125 [Marasmius oreades]|uniref:J domain-containing protein n=1 Tax=Marasmius oreades TaxID=181124 RepID=A0A9P7RU60_9AGAR|nr:uncharacterized protein E1B28_011125 [Marasmius oreades]KAG7089440.1 hypothetical protein E1B28_011125 [Marasmius oreades]
MAPTPSIKQTRHQNWYKVLGVRNDASKDDIKTAYKKLALVWHPDRHVDDKNLAITKFAEINNAYRAIMLERHIASVKAREEANNPQSSETRPPLLSRPTFSTINSRRSSSSTTVGSFTSSRQSSFESVSTPPSTPRFLSRTGSRNVDGGFMTYFDRPITLPIRTFTITPPAQSIDVTLSDLMPTPITPITPTTPRLGDATMSQIPENVSQAESPQNESNVQSDLASSSQTLQPVHVTTPKIYHPAKPKAPRKIRRGQNFPEGLPHLASLGVGTSKEWKYSLLLTLEELFSGKTCHLRIARCLLNGSQVDLVLDVHVPAGSLPGTKILFPGVGHERPDRSFQDISFVIQQLAHDRFSRVGDDLVMDAQLPWSDKDGVICFSGIDGNSGSIQIDRQNDNKRSNGSTIVYGAGMPKVHGNEVLCRGNLVIRWSIGPPPASLWRSFTMALRFRK